jgi:hypothetical protein
MQKSKKTSHESPKFFHINQIDYTDPSKTPSFMPNPPNRVLPNQNFFFLGGSDSSRRG